VSAQAKGLSINKSAGNQHRDARCSFVRSRRPDQHTLAPSINAINMDASKETSSKLFVAVTAARGTLRQISLRLIAFRMHYALRVPVPILHTLARLARGMRPGRWLFATGQRGDHVSGLAPEVIGMNPVGAS
jgi:hypothetical protein